MKNGFFLLSLCFFAGSILAQPSIEWQKSFGGSQAETPLKIINTPDGGYLVGSVTESNSGDVSGNHGSTDMWLLKIDQNGVKQWQKCLGGTFDDAMVGIDNVSTGGYILVGQTTSNGAKNAAQVFGNHGSQDIWVVKTDANGTIEWRQCYGGCDVDEVRVVQETSDGNFVLAGGTQSSNTGDVYGIHGDWDAWVLKIAPNGALIWQKTIGGSGIDYLFGLQETSNGNLVLVGSTTSIDGDLAGSDNQGAEDFWITQLAPDGTLLWNKTYGGSDSDGARALCLVNGGGLMVAGIASSLDGDVSGAHGGSDAWVLRLDDNGNLLWQKPFGGNGAEYAASIFQRADNDFIFVGQAGSTNGDVQGYHGSNDVWVVKIDKNGTLKAQSSLGGSLEDFSRSAVSGTADAVIVSGSSESNNGDVSGNHGQRDVWVVKLSVPLGLKPETPHSEALTLELTPNPVSHSLQIQTSATGLKQVDLYSMSGILLQTFEMDQLETSLPIQTLPAGKYLLSLRTQTGQVLSASFVKS